MSKKINGHVIGETWLDHAGNICYYRDNGSISCTTPNLEPTLTIQSEKDACDFNLIYAKYKKTGILTNIRKDPPMYGDFSNAVDFHTSILRIQEAEDQFMQLPASLRARFSNDPGKLIDFLADPQNRLEAQNLGLVVTPQVDQATTDEESPPVPS